MLFGDFRLLKLKNYSYFEQVIKMLKMFNEKTLNFSEGQTDELF